MQRLPPSTVKLAVETLSTDRSLLISLHPNHAENILSGVKHVEFRRVRPRVFAGSMVLIYATMPVMKVVGAFEVEQLVSMAPSRLWKAFGSGSGLTRAHMLAYFQGVDAGFGICIKHAWRIRVPKRLLEIREAIPGFTPPQCYRYLNRSQYSWLTDT
jgi:predicted transcriptional regulator